MNPTLLAVLAGFVSAALMGIISHLLVLRRLRREKLETLRTSYYEKQIRSYQKFWSLLSPTSRYWNFEDSLIVKKNDRNGLQIDSVDKFFISFRSFFYSEDGLFLSRSLRKEVFELRKSLSNLIEREKDRIEDGFLPVSYKQRKSIRNSFHQIREIVRADIGLHDVRLPSREMDLELKDPKST